MPVAGFSFAKFEAERIGAPEGKLNINNNIAIKDVEKKDFNFGATKQSGLRVRLEYSVKYSDDKKSNIGMISILGDVFFIEEEKTLSEVLSSWKKGKKLDKDIMQQIFGGSYNRCNIQALVLSRDIGLPPPVQLPKIQFS